MRLKNFLATSLLVAGAIVLAAPANAAQVVLSPAAVIGDTGSYNYPGTSHPGSFPAGNIFDHQLGPITFENFTQNYWINGDNGPAAAYITIDLGASYSNLSFDLFNTSNGGANDRGTGNFSIAGSNTLISAGPNGFTLSGPITLISGTLAAESGTGPRTAQNFTASDLGSFRYLQFLPTSVNSAVPICCGIINNYGLNELRVFGGPGVGGVPEPTSWAMMLIGFAAIGAATRSRRLTRSKA